MSHRITTLLATAAVFSATYASPISGDSIIVAGQVINGPGSHPKTLVINECDYSNKSERRITEPDSSGLFCEKIPFSFPHTFSVNYDNIFVNAFAEPGDSIFMVIDMTKSPAEYRLSGDKAEINEQYSRGASYLLKQLYNVSLPADTTALSDYLAAFKREIGRTGAILEKYIAENRLRPEVADMLFRDNIFTVANQSILYEGRNEEEKLAFFTDSIFDLLNEKNTRVMIFPYHIGALMSSFPDYAQKVPKGAVRDLMLVASANGKDSKPHRDEFFNTAYYDRIFGDSQSELNVDGISAGDIIVFEKNSIFNIDNVNPIDWILSRYAGRPVYLDVSATWCVPCRGSLTMSESVREHFKDSEISFIVLWLKSDIEEWKKFIPGIHNATHILVPDEDMSNRIMGALNLQGFPSCYMIDRTGNITSDSVPHFHSPELIDYLKSRLQ